MSEVTEYKPGTFCWVELSTTDTESAKGFYTKLFGWTFKDDPINDEAVYTRLKLRNKDVAAMYQQDEEQQKRGVPPHWTSYVSVASTDETAAKVEKLGGKLLAEPFDVFDAGRMAVIEDPCGATVAIWQPGEHNGAGIIEEPNSFCWSELVTTDTKKSREFYTSLFDWGSKIDNSAGFEYTEFLVDGESVGGMLEMDKEWGDVPPNWMIYFSVDDCDAKAQQARELGGRILVPAKNVPNVGRFATLQDLQGASFSIIRLWPQS